MLRVYQGIYLEDNLKQCYVVVVHLKIIILVVQLMVIYFYGEIHKVKNNIKLIMEKLVHL